MQRHEFLFEASRMLSESSDCRATLQSIAQLAVPDLADGCVIDLAQEDGAEARVAAARLETPRAFGTRDEGEIPTNQSPARLDLLGRLGLHAYLRIPIVAHGRQLGTIALFTEGVRALGRDDVAMAEELARRIAAALDNARLHSETERALAARDALLARVERDMRPALSAIAVAAEVQLASAPATDAGRVLREAAETSRRAVEHLSRVIDALAAVSAPGADLPPRSSWGRRDVLLSELGELEPTR